jgi:hypothetical protein
MKKLIQKWLGVDNMLGLDDVEDCIAGVLSRRYDLDGLVSKFEDLQYSFEDKEFRWDNTADAVECIVDVDELIYKDNIQELKDKLDQVQELDDRLTQLVAGYRLDVQLVKEEF